MSDEALAPAQRPTSPAPLRGPGNGRDPRSPGPSRASRSVLVLERDPLARAQIEGLLRDEGYWAVGTSDPKAAQNLLRVGAADLILADPGESLLTPVPRWARRRTDMERPLPSAFHEEGYAILRALDADPEASNYPMVLLKDVASPGDGTPTSRFGVVGYVRRGIGREGVLASIEAAYATLERLRQAAEPPPKPAAPDAPSALVPRQPPPKEESGLFGSLPKALRKALVVDPDATSRRALRKALDRHEVTVYEAADATEALRLALSARPWLIVSEVNLPGKDGFDLCAEIRAHRLLRHTPIIFISDRDSYEDRCTALKLGADDYLSKPVKVREVLIRAQLTLKRYADLRTRSRGGPGMDGEIEVIGAPGVLQMCHTSQFTGVFTSHCDGQRAQIHFRDGEIIGAETNGWKGPDAVYAFLGWAKGHFEFVMGDPGDGSPLGDSFDQLLLEGCRRLDEAARDDLSSPATA